MKTQMNCCPVVDFLLVIYLQINLMMYTRGCNVFTADLISERVTSLIIFVSLQTTSMWGSCDSVNTFLARFLISVYRPLLENCSLAISLTGFLVTSSAGSLRPILWWWGRWNAVFLFWASTTCSQAFAGYWGRCMLFSLSGSLLPAFRPCWILGEMSAVSLSGPLLPAHRPLQDNGGEVCRLLVSSPVFTMAS